MKRFIALLVLSLLSIVILYGTMKVAIVDYRIERLKQIDLHSLPTKKPVGIELERMACRQKPPKVARSCMQRLF